MIFAYLRVSTDLQTLENQRYGIKQYCKNHSLKISAFYEEKISGTKKSNERELGELLKILKKGDTIITTEFSRLGRSLSDVLETIKIIKERGAVLITIKENFVLDDSLSAKILGSVLALISDISRDLLSSRIKEALAMRKAQGQKLGRSLGSKNKHSKLEQYHEYIEMALKSGKTRYWLKKHLKTHSHTLNSYLINSGLAKKYEVEINKID